jgi:hypothetical protein
VMSVNGVNHSFLRQRAVQKKGSGRHMRLTVQS